MIAAVNSTAATALTMLQAMAVNEAQASTSQTAASSHPSRIDPTQKTSVSGDAIFAIISAAKANPSANSTEDVDSDPYHAGKYSQEQIESMTLKAFTDTMSASDSDFGLSVQDYAALKAAIAGGTVKMTALNAIAGVGNITTHLFRDGLGHAMGGSVETHLNDDALAAYTNHSTRTICTSAVGDNENINGGFLLSW